jgi:hypothetical protein
VTERDDEFRVHPRAIENLAWEADVWPWFTYPRAERPRDWETMESISTHVVEAATRELRERRRANVAAQGFLALAYVAATAVILLENPTFERVSWVDVLIVVGVAAFFALLVLGAGVVVAQVLSDWFDQHFGRARADRVYYDARIAETLELMEADRASVEHVE